MPIHAPGITPLPGNGLALSALGCNATLIRRGELVSFHFPGPAAVAKCAAHCDRFGYRVVTLSTPRTIYRDLQGTRQTLSDWNEHTEGRTGNRMIQRNTPEPKLLASIGRLDLLARDE